MSTPALLVARMGDLFVADVTRGPGTLEILTLRSMGWRSAHNRYALERLGPTAERVECLSWCKTYGARVVLTRWTA